LLNLRWRRCTEIDGTQSVSKDVELIRDVVVVVAITIVSTIAKWLVKRLTTAAEDVHFFTLVTTERTPILIDNVYVPLDDNRAFRIAADL